jgi:hypothetical protein
MAALSCPSPSTPNSLGCSVSRCCDAVSCVPNLPSGPCVCASYGDPSPSQSGWNYSFMAQCSGSNVSTVWGTSCDTLLGVQYAYSCYCRPRVAGDTGVEGDKVNGNVIFQGDSCGLFKAAAATTSVPPMSTPSKTGGAESKRPTGIAMLIGCAVMLPFVVQMLWV